MNIEIPEQALPPGFTKFRNFNLSDMGPRDKERLTRFQAPLKRFQELQKTLEGFIQENNLQKLYQDEQYDVFDLYKDIKEALHDNAPTREPLAIGRLSQHQNMALAIALKEFMPKYNGRLLLKTTAEGGAINYIHVNPDAINHFLNLLEDDDEAVRDSVQGFGFATLRNIMIEVLFEGLSVISKQNQK